MKPGNISRLSVKYLPAILLGALACLSCFPDTPHPEFSQPEADAELAGFTPVRVRTRSLWSCDTVVLFGDALCSEELVTSDPRAQSWEGFCWPSPVAGSGLLYAVARNPWFSETCVVSVTSTRPCSILADTMLQGYPREWRLSFSLTAGYDYDLTIWETTNFGSPPTWDVIFGRYGNGEWDIIMATAKIAGVGAHVRFSPDETGRYEIGLKGRAGHVSRFLLLGLAPLQ